MNAMQLSQLLPTPEQLRPQGPPQATTVRGNPHMLAYITPEEAYILRNRGGGVGAGGGQLAQGGVPAFDDNDSSNSTSDGQSAGGGVGGGGAGSSGAGASGSGEAGPSGPDGAGGPGTGGGTSDSQSSGGFGGEASDGQGGFGGIGSGGAGGHDGGADTYTNVAPAPARAPAPTGPTAEDLAAQEAARRAALANEAEQNVRNSFGASLNDTWRQALAGQFRTEAQTLLANAYGTARTGTLDSLKAGGYDRTPIAAYRLTGLDKQRDNENARIDTVWGSRNTAYQNSINDALAKAIAEARATYDPAQAGTIANRYITGVTDSIRATPGDAFVPNLATDSGAVGITTTPVQKTAADVFRNNILTQRTLAPASRVVA